MGSCHLVDANFTGIDDKAVANTLLMPHMFLAFVGARPICLISCCTTATCKWQLLGEANDSGKLLCDIMCNDKAQRMPQRAVLD